MRIRTIVVTVVLVLGLVAGCNTFEDLEAIQLRDATTDLAGDVDQDTDVSDAGDADAGEACGSTICEVTEYCCDRGNGPECVAHGDENCGDCGVTCDGAGQICGDSGCVCEPPLGDCDTPGVCEINLLSSGSHCGACGNTCPGDQSCLSGECDGLVEVALGNAHLCVLLTSGRVFCRGANADHQVDESDDDLVRVLTLIPDLPEVASISSYDDHTCAVTTNEELWCWGDNSAGQLGLPNQDVQRNPVQVPLDGAPTQVTTGDDFTCALVTDQLDSNELWCWGQEPMLDEIGANTLTPQQEIGQSWVAIDAGNNHLCALDQSRQVHCWGSGDKVDPDSPTSAVEVVNAANADQVDVGSFHSCLRELEQIRCWGDSQYLPDGASGDVNPFSTFSTGGTHTCAVENSTGEVYCWGADASEQLGNGDGDTSQSQPMPVQGANAPDSVRDVYTGKTTVCAIDEDGVLFCWGSNTGRQLVDNQQNEISLPVEVMLF